MPADSPSVITAGFSVLRALLTVRRPNHTGSATTDHASFADVLTTLDTDGSRALAHLVDPLLQYLDAMADVDPAGLSTEEGLAYWLNVYNAGALSLAGNADAAGVPSVLRIPGGFSRPFVRVGGESLSLDDIEHGKIRRYRDPRVHAAIVCGAISCPTLRPEPYEGSRIAEQLDDQMRHFLSAGAATVDEESSTVRLSRVFLWYGADFARPHRMPVQIPARRRRVFDGLTAWLPPGAVEAVHDRGFSIGFAPYDWGLRCTVG